jgi:hypothetical protein
MYKQMVLTSWFGQQTVRQEMHSFWYRTIIHHITWLLENVFYHPRMFVVYICYKCNWNTPTNNLILFFALWLFSRSIGDPGNADLVLKTGRECKGKIGTYRPTANGNLKYFHGTTAYDICIGSESAISTEPHENENVSIQKSVCDKNNSCKLSYGKILSVVWDPTLHIFSTYITLMNPIKFNRSKAILMLIMQYSGFAINISSHISFFYSNIALFVRLANLKEKRNA